jgi:hypothetical protein
MRRRNSSEAVEATGFIKTCLLDLADPTRQSLKRKRRALYGLAYWAEELERLVNEGKARPYNPPGEGVREWEGSK